MSQHRRRALAKRRARRRLSFLLVTTITAVLAVTAQADDWREQGECLRVADPAEAGDVELYFPYVVCAQLYAFHRSLALGNTPDQPSNSGTVTRVVHGVTVHTL